MPFKRKIHWYCSNNSCDIEIIEDSFGLPEGWIYTSKANEKIKHYCDDCKHSIPQNQWMRNGERFSN